MLTVLPMARKRTKGTDAGKVKREQSHIRIYYEQAELLNELADADRSSIADVVEKYLAPEVRKLIQRIYTDKAKKWSEAQEKSSRSKSE